MKKLFRILTGWGKAFGWLPVSTPEKKLSELRLKICGICEESETSKALRIINDEAIHGYQLRCLKCKCPCLEKSLVVDEKCPLSKW